MPVQFIPIQPMCRSLYKSRRGEINYYILFYSSCRTTRLKLEVGLEASASSRPPSCRCSAGDPQLGRRSCSRWQLVRRSCSSWQPRRRSFNSLELMRIRSRRSSELRTRSISLGHQVSRLTKLQKNATKAATRPGGGPRPRGGGGGGGGWWWWGWCSS
jgi:hypothetical protein